MFTKYFTHTIKSFALVAAFLLVSTSCEKVLETSPKGVLVEGVVSEGTADKQVNAAYQAMGAHFFGNYEAMTGPGSNWVIDVRSDDCYKGGGGTVDLSDVHQLETATYFPDNSAIFNKWRNLMFAIARTNVAITQIAEIESNTYPKDVRTAEMRFLRGYFHFDLKRNFKQVPYLSENDDPNATSNTALTDEQFWTKVEADFQFAYDKLPVTQDLVGRATKYAAAAFLTKLYVQTQQWSKASAMADFVLSGPFDLLNDFQDLSTLQHENGEEIVFAIQYSTANLYANHDWGNLLNVTASPGIDNGGYAAGDDFYLASQDLVNAYRTDASGLPLFDTYNDQVVANGLYAGSLDPRVDFSFGRIGIPWKGTAVYSDAWVRSPDYYPGYSSKKHVVAPDDPNVHNSFPWAASGLNFTLVRLAEVKLWKAEALIEMNQSLDEARTLINDVRRRAQNSTYVKTLDGSRDAANYNIGLYPSSGWTQDYARKALRFERRLELAMEGHRFFDLVRWGIAAETMNSYYQSEAARVDYLSGVTFTANKHEYLPIPQSEIDLAPTIYSQHSDY